MDICHLGRPTVATKPQTHVCPEDSRLSLRLSPPPLRAPTCPPNCLGPDDSFSLTRSLFPSTILLPPHSWSLHEHLLTTACASMHSEPAAGPGRAPSPGVARLSLRCSPRPSQACPKASSCSSDTRLRFGRRTPALPALVPHGPCSVSGSSFVRHGFLTQGLCSHPGTLYRSPQNSCPGLPWWRSG